VRGPHRPLSFFRLHPYIPYPHRSWVPGIRISDPTILAGVFVSSVWPRQQKAAHVNYPCAATSGTRKEEVQEYRSPYLYPGPGRGSVKYRTKPARRGFFFSAESEIPHTVTDHRSLVASVLLRQIVSSGQRYTICQASLMSAPQLINTITFARMAYPLGPP
jgi:hypothetical protein